MRFGRGIGILKLRLTGENAGADGLQREGFTGQDLGLRLDVVFEIEHVIVRIGALERKNVGVLAAELDARGGDINRLHAEGGNRNDGDHREHERNNEPLMFAEDEQVVVKMGLARREFEGRAHGLRETISTAPFEGSSREISLKSSAIA